MTAEKVGSKTNGWAMVVLLFAILLAAVYGFIRSISSIEDGEVGSGAITLVVSVVILIAATVSCAGMFILEPNEAAVLILFGKYNGTVKEPGFWWVNPFTSKRKISQRARNFDSEQLKVNDKKGNPIEISVVVVWRVDNTAQATFDIEDYAAYIRVQTESAVRHLASIYPYDDMEGEPVTLRFSTDEVSEALGEEIRARIHTAGLDVVEARIRHLAYAPEIAHSMLQRQQAEAVIAARQKIVEGAVGMVEMALAKLNERGVVTLDEERKAAMVSNLLVVLCGDQRTQPVINAGTLY